MLFDIDKVRQQIAKEANFFYRISHSEKFKKYAKKAYKKKQDRIKTCKLFYLWSTIEF